MKLKQSDVGRWAMIQWTDGITAGLIVEADETGGKVFELSNPKGLQSIDNDQVIKVGTALKFDPPALGLKKL